MNFIDIIAQVFGLGATVSLFLIYQQKTRKGMLLAKLSADVFWVIHYFLLSAYSGMIPNAVGMLREVVFIQRKEKRWANSIKFPVLFVLINWGLGFRSFNDWYNILPIAASTVVTLSLWIDKPRLTKIISIPISLSFLIYDIHVDSYIGVVNEAIAICSIIIYFVKEIICFIKEKKNVQQ